MAEHEPRTQTVDVTDAQRDFKPLVKRVSKLETRVLVEEDGLPVAALVSPSDLDELTLLDGYRRDPWSVVDDIHADNRDKDPDEVERDVAEAIAEVRAEVAERLEHGEGQ